MISGRVTQAGGDETDSGVLAKLVAKGGEPFVRKGVEFAVRLLAERFVSGATIDDALWRATDAGALGFTRRSSVSMASSLWRNLLIVPIFCSSLRIKIILLASHVTQMRTDSLK